MVLVKKKKIQCTTTRKHVKLSALFWIIQQYPFIWMTYLTRWPLTLHWLSSSCSLSPWLKPLASRDSSSSTASSQRCTSSLFTWSTSTQASKHTTFTPVQDTHVNQSLTFVSFMLPRMHCSMLSWSRAAVESSVQRCCSAASDSFSLFCSISACRA